MAVALSQAVSSAQQQQHIWFEEFFATLGVQHLVLGWSTWGVLQYCTVLYGTVRGVFWGGVPGRVRGSPDSRAGSRPMAVAPIFWFVVIKASMHNTVLGMAATGRQ